MTTMTMQRRTPDWQWVIAAVMAVLVPPVAFVFAVVRLVDRRTHEWLGWATLAVFSLALTVLLGGVVFS